MSNKKKPAKHKLDLTRTLGALDARNKAFYDGLTEDERKGYSAVILQRYMSATNDDGQIHEYHLLAVNDIHNDEYVALYKYPDLQYQLLSLVGLGKKQYHPWLGFPTSKKPKTKVFEFWRSIYPDLNEDEFNILRKTVTKQQLTDICKEQGMTDDEIKEITGEWK